MVVLVSCMGDGLLDHQGGDPHGDPFVDDDPEDRQQHKCGDQFQQEPENTEEGIAGSHAYSLGGSAVAAVSRLMDLTWLKNSMAITRMTV